MEVAQRRLSMRSVHEVLCLKYKLDRSHREIAAVVGSSLGTVSSYLSRAEAAGLSRPLPEKMDDDARSGPAHAKLGRHDCLTRSRTT